MWTRQCFLVYSEPFNCLYNPISEHFNPPRSLVLISNPFSALHSIFLSPLCPRQTTNLFSVSIMLVTQSCPTLCDPVDCSLPGSSFQGFSRQKFWSWEPFPSAGDLLDSGIKSGSPALQADSFPSEPPGKPQDLPILDISYK